MKTNRHLALLLYFLIVSSSCLHAQTAWHLRHPLPSPGVWGGLGFLWRGGLFGVTYGNGHFVAVGYGGTVLTSTNGATWTSRFPESDGNLYDVAYGNGKFVAVGGGDFLTPNVNLYGWDSTTVLASADGTTWTETVEIRGFRVWRLVFANDVFVGFGSTESELPAIVTSPDGVTWTERWRGKEMGGSSWGEQEDLSAVAIAVGNGTIVVKAPTTDGCGPQSFLVSTNSLSWVEAPTGLSNGCIQSLRLSYGLGRFVAVVLAQTPFVGVPDNKVLISGDGFTWENISGNWDIFDESLSGDALGFGNGSFFVLAIAGPIALTSTDGRSWTERSVTGLELGIGIHTVSKFVYAQNLFVIVGQRQTAGCCNGFPYIFTSPDGMNWSRRVGGTNYGLSGVAASDRRVVALASVAPITDLFGGPAGYDTVILASTDGTEWRQTEQFGGQDFSAIVYGSGLFLVAGNSGILTSPDGVTWTRQTNAGAEWSRVRSGMNRILALGGDFGTDGTYHYKLGTSSDGLAWAIQRMDNVIHPRDVATDGHSVVLIDERNDGSGGMFQWSIWRSAESSTWVEVYRDSSPSPSVVAYGNGHYLIPKAPYNTNGPTVLISSDGLNWTKDAPVIENGIGDLIFDGIGDLIFANGRFYATGGIGVAPPRVFSSPDGMRWKRHPTGFHQQLVGLAAGPQGLFALGSAGGILYSPWDLVLSGPERALKGALRINVTGPPGANVQLQRGTTLTDWADWQTVTLSDAPVQVEDSEVAALPHRFYRAVTR